MGILERYRSNKKVSDHEEVVKHSNNLYQLKENGGNIWITYDGNLVCPSEMLNVQPVEAVQKMREMFIERTPKLPRL